MTDSADRQMWMLLLRGINVNPSTRITMADLRGLLGGLGYEGVTTLLQSGNILLSAPNRPTVGPIESAILAQTGVASKALVLSVAEFAAIAAANPLLDAGDDLSRMVVTFLDGDIVPSKVERPSDADLDPERLAITERAIYQWCPDGILRSKLTPSWWRQFDVVATSRNVRTVNRILAASLGP